MIDALASNLLALAIGAALVQFLWQGAVLGGVTFLALTTLRHAGAQTRYVVACLGLFAMTAAPVVTVARYAAAYSTPLASAPEGTPRPPDAAWSSDLTRSSRLAPLEAASGFWSRDRVGLLLPIVVLVWSLCVMALTLRLAARWMVTQRMRRHARPLPDAWRTRCLALAAGMGATRRLGVVLSPYLDVPAVVGWIRPIILVPASTLAGLSPEQLEAVIAHELAHIRRHDYVVNVLQSVVETLLFYHPAVWWVSRRMRVEREYCCDDLAVRACGDRVGYARALASLEELRTTPALAVAANGGELLGRIRRLLGVPHERPSLGREVKSFSVSLASTRVGPRRMSISVVSPAPPVKAIRGE